MNQLFTAPTDLAPATLAKSADINAITAVVGTAFNKLPTELELKTGTINYAVDTGTANAYLVALPYAPASYTDGLSVVFKALNTNTGASTINVNGLGAKTIRLSDDHVVYAGDITAGSSVTLRYSSTTGYFHVAANSVVAANRAAQSVVDAAAQVALATIQADNAAASYDSFDDRYLGSKAAPPTLDNDGAALLVGAMYWNNSSDTMWAYTGSTWSALSPTDAEMALITIVGGELTVTEDLGSITAAITTGTGNNISIVGDAIANVNTVAVSVADVNTVATNIASVNSVAGNATNINSAVSNATNINSAVSNATNINLVAGSITSVNLVSGSIANVNAVAGNASNINSVFSNEANINSAVSNASNINSAVSNAANINSAVGNETNINSVVTNSANINLAAGSITNINLVGGSIANVSTVAGSIADVNRYADEYKIASSAPASASAGDLWYDSTVNTLKYYSGSVWESISAGIAAVVDDTTPQLGGALDGQNNNMTNIGTVSGSNLQLDFGGL